MAIWAKRRGRTCSAAGSILASCSGSRVGASMPRSGSGSRVAALAVVVVAAAALAAEPAFGDQLLLDRARPPALRLAALVEEGAGDLEVDVEADQVDQLERAHPEAAAEADDAVDRRRVGDAVAEHPQRLQREGAGEAVGDEAGAVLGADRGAAHPLGRPRSSPPAPPRRSRSAATTSTSFISAGGLKKCMPTTRSGCGTPAAIAVDRAARRCWWRGSPRARRPRPARRRARASARASPAPPRSPGRSRPARRGSVAVSSRVARPLRPPPRSSARARRPLPAPRAAPRRRASSASGSGSWRTVS